MGIKAHFTGNISATFDAFLSEVDRQLIETCYRVGEEAIIYARSDHPNNWKDHTHNLRSSVGYGVFVDGKLHTKGGFKQEQPTEIQEGVQLDGAATGENLCRQIGEQTTGITLVVVAGMSYAVYVESKGRDVLTTAELNAQKGMERELADMVRNIKAAFE